jgi:ABC-2 type transport system ATP-binding protein
VLVSLRVGVHNLPMRRRPVPRRVRPVAVISALALVIGLSGLTVLAPPAAATTAAGVTETEAMVPVGTEPDGTPVQIDTSTFAPGTTGRHPALLLAHGFGGSKTDLDTQAKRYAAQGWVVVTYTARGFGASGGRIHLDDPALEVADARTLVDTLAARDDVRLDATGDPRVAVAGGSYGGALALMLGATDPRIDGIVASITWNDLALSLFPQQGLPAGDGQPTTPARIDPTDVPGIYKQLWGSRFFAGSIAGSQGTSAPPATSTTSTTPTDLLCGRFDLSLCHGLTAAAETGTPAPELLDTLRGHGPNAVIGDRMPPTLLIQGLTDSLFGLDQADANARAIAATGAPLAVRWTDGGHDARSATQAQDDAAAEAWLGHYVKAETKPALEGSLPVAAFTYALPQARRQSAPPLVTLPAYPGLGEDDATWSTIPLVAAKDSSRILTPPGGQPASTTSIPGLAAAGLSLPTYQLAALPGQSAHVDTRDVQRMTIVGSPRVTLTITSVAPEVTLFVSLWQVQGSAVSQPRPLVAPVRARVTPGVPTEVTVALPAGTWTVEQGSTWRVLVTSTDTAFAGSRDARADVIAFPTALAVPTAVGTPVSVAGERDTESWLLAGALVALLAGLGARAWWARRRRARLPFREDLAEVPLVVSHLVKTYADGHRAVDDVSWRAERGQVVGLLGPNGAGKTTTMRMMLGLIRPDSGTVHVAGHPITPGAPILGRVGALVEGPGFLPHLTGRENLQAFWRATGRPAEEAGFEEALDVAALGGALDRPVRTYSHGMKQRLGIAQAMLGKPDVLFLDEPTNGLDPPQIAAMRPILQAYAATGRTVVVSSHLLAEVEMTCSHVVVMHAGRVVTAGPVAELVASEDTTVIETASATMEGALATLTGAHGIRSVEVIDEGDRAKITVVADRPRPEVVRLALDAGLDVTGVGSRRHLEEVFLGVIASAQEVGGAQDSGAGGVVERLRQVRAR